MYTGKRLSNVYQPTALQNVHKLNAIGLSEDITF